MEDLIERYKDDSHLLNKIKEYRRHKLFTIHTKYKVGQIISFIGGYNNDINYITKIIGFDNDGGIFLLWDCYWYPIRDEEIRKIKVLTNKEFLDIKVKHATKVRDVKLTHNALDELIDLYE